MTDEQRERYNRYQRTWQKTRRAALKAARNGQDARRVHPALLGLAKAQWTRQMLWQERLDRWERRLCPASVDDLDVSDGIHRLTILVGTMDSRPSLDDLELEHRR